jgi:hypothetical protein
VLRFGIFNNFKGCDTILLWGDAIGFERLQAIFQEFASGARHSVALQEMTWAEAVRGARLHIELRSRWATANIDLAAATVTWRCSVEEFSDNAEQLATLISPSCAGGHQYLDYQENPALQIIASKGEYPDSLS